MTPLDEMKALMSSGIGQTAKDNILSDIFDALLGDKEAEKKVSVKILSSPFLFREYRFLWKFEAYLKGTYLSETDRLKLSAILTEKGENGENPFRLLESIERAETLQKIQFIVNVSRCLLAGFIELTDFFRICHAVAHTLEEDLMFLRDHIEESNIVYSTYVQGLYTAGLMYISISGQDQRYSFTPLAEMVDQYAVSFDNVERYPDPTRKSLNIENPRQEIEGVPIVEID